MDRILHKAEGIDLTSDDILEITRGATNIIAYSDLHSANTVEDVFADKPTACILYQTKKNFGHWVALLKDEEKNTIEFFDSYALSPDEELKYSSHNLRIHDNQIQPHLTALINNSNYKLIYNKVKLQKVLRDVNTCGRHCALRILLRNYSLPHYIHLMTENRGYDADMWATILTITYSI